MVNDDSIEEYDISQAKKLLDHIRIFKDIRHIDVPDPKTLGLKRIKFGDWVKWYHGQIEVLGDTGFEGEILKIIFLLDNHIEIFGNRVEDGFRKLLDVVQRKNVKIQLLESKVSAMTQHIDEMEHTLYGTELTENIEENIENNETEEQEVKPNKRKRLSRKEQIKQALSADIINKEMGRPEQK